LRGASWEAVEQAFEQVVCADWVGVERVEGGGLDADGAPVRTELVRDDLGEGGVATSPSPSVPILSHAPNGVSPGLATRFGA
jgi:hypothetical protein